MVTSSDYNRSSAVWEDEEDQLAVKKQHVFEYDPAVAAMPVPPKGLLNRYVEPFVCLFNLIC